MIPQARVYPPKGGSLTGTKPTTHLGQPGRLSENVVPHGEENHGDSHHRKKFKPNLAVTKPQARKCLPGYVQPIHGGEAPSNPLGWNRRDTHRINNPVNNAMKGVVRTDALVGSPVKKGTPP